MHCACVVCTATGEALTASFGLPADGAAAAVEDEAPAGTVLSPDAEPASAVTSSVPAAVISAAATRACSMLVWVERTPARSRAGGKHSMCCQHSLTGDKLFAAKCSQVSAASVYRDKLAHVDGGGNDDGGDWRPKIHASSAEWQSPMPINLPAQRQEAMLHIRHLIVKVSAQLQ